MNALGQRHGMPVAAARTVADPGPRIDELAHRDPACTDVRTTAMAQPNNRITLTSSRAGELTFLAVTDPRRGTQSKGSSSSGAPRSASRATPTTRRRSPRAS